MPNEDKRNVEEEASLKTFVDSIDDAFRKRKELNATFNNGDSVLENEKVIEKEFPANTDKLHEVLAFVEDELEKHNCPIKTQMLISVMVEEIFVNIALYAYPDSEGKATIGMQFSNDSVTVFFKDTGIEFNPLAKEDPDVTLKAEDREIGGLGIYMVKKSMDDVTYIRNGNENILSFKKRII